MIKKFQVEVTKMLEGKFIYTGSIVFVLIVVALTLHSHNSSASVSTSDVQQIATTKNAVWHLRNGKLRYCMIRSSEIVCVEEQ